MTVAKTNLAETNLAKVELAKNRLAKNRLAKNRLAKNRLAKINFAQIATCAAVLIALSAAGAEAAPALATNNVNMRQGPGTNYPVVTTIPGGSNVEVNNCYGEWCSVTWNGQSGYAVARNLDRGQGAPPGAGGPPPPPGAGAPPPPPGGPGGPPPPGATAQAP